MSIKWRTFWIFHYLFARVWLFLKHKIHQTAIANMLLKNHLDKVCNYVFKDVKLKKNGWLTLHMCCQDGVQSLKQWNTSSFMCSRSLTYRKNCQVVVMSKLVSWDHIVHAKPKKTLHHGRKWQLSNQTHLGGTDQQSCRTHFEC